MPRSTGRPGRRCSVPGLNAPPLQYVRGKSRALTMELFFDTYEAHEDVRQ